MASLIDGRPRGSDDDDDDFIVDLEDAAEDDMSTLDDDEVEDADPPELESSNLPEGVEEEDEEPAAKNGKGADVDVDDDDALTQARIAADEARENAVRVQTEAIKRDAENQWTLVQSEVSKADMALSTLGIHIENAQAALAQARDTGDTRNEIAIQGKLNDLMGLKTQIEQAKSQAPTKDQIYGRAQQQINQVAAEANKRRGTNVGDGIVAVNPMAERWAKQNTWMKTNRSANNFVVAQSKGMVREGWDMNTPGFYAELSRRVGRAFPGVKATPLQAKKKAPTRAAQKHSSPVAPGRSSMTSGAPAQKPASGQRYTLNAADQQAMRRMNLDPMNKAHRKEFARSRMETSRRSVV